MVEFLVILGIVIIGSTFVFPGEQIGFMDLYEKHGKRYNINPVLLRAIAKIESSENANAVNPLDPSYGLMQVLCVSDGVGSCKNRFNVKDWPPDSKGKLFDPDYNLHIASQVLAWNIKQFGLKKGIACYNNWGARHDPKDGPYRNQGYVDKVLGVYEGLKIRSRL